MVNSSNLDQMEISASNSPEHSSPDDVDADDDHPVSLTPGQQAADLNFGTTAGIEGTSATALPNGASSSGPAQPAAKATPIQKRRRVTRACDECRRKKIKCDGKQPCTHCTVYSYDCTYDQPSNRRRNPTPQYIEALEVRMQRAEALLRVLLPNVDLNDPNVEALVLQQAQANAARHAVRPDLTPVDAKSPLSPASVSTSEQQSRDAAEVEDARIRSMIENTGQLDLDENNNWDFHGSSSGAVFFRRMREHLGGLLGDNKKTNAPFLPRAPRPPSISHISHDTPRSGSGESPLDVNIPNVNDLPSKDITLVLCANALSSACALLRFIHQPSFYAMVDRIYDTPPESMGSEENRFLPLLYSVLAVGSVFEDPVMKTEIPEQANYKAAIESGLKYFQSARSMIEITDCRDIMSLQALLFMILFLQCSANLSVCYSYVGIALRSAIRLGLHRNLTANFNPIEQQVRSRTFWIIRKMDIYVSAMLGFPQLLREEDIDQEYPLEVDDEFITAKGILPMPPGRVSLLAAGNAHAQLMNILSKVIQYIYPIKDLEHAAKGDKAHYSVSHALIRECEGELQAWLDKLPLDLRPYDGAPVEVIRVQQLLRMSYAHVQMMLYRPFLHYVSPSNCAGKAVDQRSYACAAAGVSVSRNIIHITAEMKKRGLLTGAYWFTMYTTFFAIISLVYFVLENPDAPGTKDMLRDAMTGKETLKEVAKRSLAADRCSHVLRSLFDRLPERLQRRQDTPVAKQKKRPAPSPKLNPASIRAQTFRDDMQQRPNSASAAIKPFQRAATFPARLTTPGQLRNSASFDGTNFNMYGPDGGLQQAYQEIASPTDGSTAHTPDSATPNSFQQPMMPPDTFGGNEMFSDLGAMMFPSADPFAYPNQPLMEFDNQQQKNQLGAGIANNGSPSMYLSNENPVNRFSNIEGQFFGPFPSYLTQGIANADPTGQIPDVTGTSTLNAQNPSFAYQGMGPDAAATFDEIFTGTNDDWSGMFTQ